MRDKAAREALGAVLRTGMDGQANGVRFGSGGRATAPHVTIGDIIAVNWDTNTAAGREVRCSVSIRDTSETADRLEGLMALAEAAIETMPRDLPGWRVASLVFLQSRIGRDGTSGWIGAMDYRLRLIAT